MVEIRRIQETGKGSLIVTIPKGWARKHNISRGSVIFVEEGRDGSLILRSKEKRNQSSVVIKFSGMKKEQIEWGIVGAYLLGFDKIILRSKGPLSLEEREKVREVIKKLVGVEIVDEGRHEIAMQCMVDMSFMRPLNLFKRVNSLTMDMVQNSLRLLDRYDERLSSLIIKRDNEVDRLYFLLIRILRATVDRPALADKLGLRPIDCLDYRVAAQILEKIGDAASELAGEVRSLTSRITDSKKLKRISNILREAQMEAFLAFLEKSTDRLWNVRRLNSELKLILNDMMEDLADESARCILQILEKIGELCVDLSDLVIPVKLMSEA